MSMLRPGFTGVFVVGSQHLPGYAAKKSRKNTFKINDERHFGIFSQPPISDEGKKQRYSKFLFSSQFCLCLLDARNMRESEREIDER